MNRWELSVINFEMNKCLIRYQVSRKSDSAIRHNSVAIREKSLKTDGRIEQVKLRISPSKWLTVGAYAIERTSAAIVLIGPTYDTLLTVIRTLG